MMNYSDYTTEDFITDEKFIRWVKNSNPSIDTFWNDWLSQNPSKANDIEEARSFILSMQNDHPDLAENEVEKILHNIHSEMREENTRIVKKIPLYKMAAAAAVLLFVISGVFLFNNRNNTISTAFNESETIQLPDGSEVILNANSSFKTKKNWKEEAIREVWLEGEAYFNVTHSPAKGKRRFVVYTKDIDVEVLGTSFNVNARNQKTTVVLESGNIQLTTPTINKEIVDVIPGERVILQSKKLDKAVVNTNVYTAWRNKKLVFDNTPFSYLIEVLENNYGFEVDVQNQKIKNKQLTGTAPLQENPEILLKSISTMFDFKVKRIGNKIVIE